MTIMTSYLPAISSSTQNYKQDYGLSYIARNILATWLLFRLNLRMEFCYSLDQVKEFATLFWNHHKHGSVFAFHGEMGAGKTSFIHALCDVKKVKDVVGSPTFSIINEYSYVEDGVEKMIYHIDLYRLKDEEETLRAGVEDCLYSDHTCLVEWPEKAPAIFPEHTIHVYMEWVNSDTRRLRIPDK